MCYDQQMNFYSDVSPEKRRLYDLEHKINRWRKRGDLFISDDPEIEETLKEYDALKSQVLGAYDFSTEDWSTNEEDQDPTPDVRHANERSDAETTSDPGPDGAD